MYTSPSHSPKNATHFGPKILTKSSVSYAKLPVTGLVQERCVLIGSKALLPNSTLQYRFCDGFTGLQSHKQVIWVVYGSLNALLTPPKAGGLRPPRSRQLRRAGARKPEEGLFG